MPTCQRHGIGTMIYSSLGGGVLTGKYKRGEDPPEGSRAARGGLWARMVTEQGLATAEEVARIASERGTTATAVALAWVLSRRGVTSVIIGPSTCEQYVQNMEGFSLTLDPSTLKQLSDASKWAR